MRKFMMVLLVIVAVVSFEPPAEANTWPRWVRPVNKQVTVQFERTRVSAAVWAQLVTAMRVWSRSGRVDAVPVARCTNPRAYCVKVTEYRAADHRGGHTVLYADPRTNRAWYGTLQVNLYYASTRARLAKISCHEVGHALGAVHRYGNTCMSDGLLNLSSTPNAADYAYLQAIYRYPG